MESRKLEDWEEMGRKEDRQGKTLLSICQTDKRTHMHTHPCMHTFLTLRVPFDTLFHSH